MYKVITHNIKEEHFDHPMTAEIGFQNYSNVAPKMNQTSFARDEIMLKPNSVEFRMSIESLLSRFFWRTRDYLISLLDSRESSDVETELYKNIDQIGSFIEPYFGTSISNEFDNSVKDLIKNLIFIVRDIKANKDITVSRNELSTSIHALANFLYRINTTQWPEDAVFSIFSDISNNWIGQISSRKNKDWIEDMILVNKNEELMLSGNPESGEPPFSEIFAKGIIASNQERFI